MWSTWKGNISSNGHSKHYYYRNTTTTETLLLSKQYHYRNTTTTKTLLLSKQYHYRNTTTIEENFLIIRTGDKLKTTSIKFHVGEMKFPVYENAMSFETV